MEKISVLNVDDEPINRMLFKSIFKNKYNVLTAESGLSGLEVLRNNADIDVVISDMRMPEMNGIEFIRKARQLYPGIFYFMLTGFDITPEIQKALETGLLCKCFRKPLDVKEIDEAIQEKMTIK
jgi:two-component system response regulator (stage 0 sporulation protein F)